jgi:hypothetical protein
MYHSSYFCHLIGQCVFDFYYLPLNIENSQESPDLPGLMVSASPRSANRNRAGDILTVLLTPNDPQRLSVTDMGRLLEKIAGTYYKTPGAVTASLREVTDLINETFLKLNQKFNTREQLSIALNLVVAHRNVLFMMQSGPTINLLLGSGRKAEPFEPLNRTFTIGLVPTFNPALHQELIQPGDSLVLWSNPVLNFTAGLPSGSGRVSLEQLRRNMAGNGTGPLRAAIGQFRPGSGAIHILRPRLSLGESVNSPAPAGFSPSEKTDRQPAAGVDSLLPPEPVSPPPAVTQPVPVEAPPPRPKPPVIMAQPPRLKLTWQERFTSLVHGKKYVQQQRQEKVRRVAGPALQRARTEPATAQAQAALAVPQQPPAAGAQQPAGGVEKPPSQPEKTSSSKAAGFRKRLAAVWQGGKTAGNRLGKESGKFLTQVLPGSGEQPVVISPSLMLFIAVAVPLVVVSFAATIYFREGPGKQHQMYLDQAQALMVQAGSQEDPILQRSALVQALSLLDKAEQYLVTDSSRALRIESQQALDNADGVDRVIFEPVSDVIDGTVNVTRMQASTSETYMLDKSSGSILRLYRTDQRYVLDRSFDCRPGQVGLSSVGPLVDLVILPAFQKAAVLGVDRAGNLLYCAPGKPPLSKALVPPDMNWGEISRLYLEDGVLYVLDIKNNSIYLYTGEDFNYSEKPHLFFDDQVPLMSNVIDIKARAEELYILHDDGMMTRCTFRSIQGLKTRCTEPAHYTDTRYGKTDEILTFPAARFIQLITTQPPEPSVYILDQNVPAVYRFGLNLTLYRQLQMQVYTNFTKPKRPVTAFTISPGQRLWLAFGNQIFYGQMP